MFNLSRILLTLVFSWLTVGYLLTALPVEAVGAEVTVESWGVTEDGQEIQLYTLRNHRGMVVRLMDYGATVVSVETADRQGQTDNINVGFSKLEDYFLGHPYFGATVGRYCNRIANGKFSIAGTEYTLAQNNGDHHLHGGTNGYNRVVWTGRVVRRIGSVGVEFSYLSADGEEGYPGNVSVTATYRLTARNELIVDLQARTDQATPINLTNHNYWNLGGVGSGTIHDHHLQVEADLSLAVDQDLIPTGEMVPVKGTPLDFREPHKMGERINQNTLEPNGYDHCFALRSLGRRIALAATVTDPKSGRVMKIFTDQPGLQFYTGNFLSGSEADGGHPYQTAFCLETQHFPDSPNIDNFPTTLLQPGKKYRHITVHAFSTQP
ncbi:MAG: aldose epimerase family protein [Planctomycetota bacterium]|nr:aldose epimerase family protein [Planctomycetota bacterium]